MSILNKVAIEKETKILFSQSTKIIKTFEGLITNFKEHLQENINELKDNSSKINVSLCQLVSMVGFFRPL